jgi:hypothetical protein
LGEKKAQRQWPKRWKGGAEDRQSPPPPLQVQRVIATQDLHHVFLVRKVCQMFGMCPRRKRDMIKDLLHNIFQGFTKPKKYYIFSIHMTLFHTFWKCATAINSSSSPTSTSSTGTS